jgi:hypothetical protein
MRDFRDAKAMARSLRDALNANAVQTTHSEALELIAKAFGYENWNILSARIDAAQPSAGVQNPAQQDRPIYCSFCGMNEHEVSKLVAGPAVFICDECIDLCTDIVDEQLIRLIEGDADSARAMPTDRLLHYVEHANRGWSAIGCCRRTSKVLLRFDRTPWRRMMTCSRHPKSLD